MPDVRYRKGVKSTAHTNNSPQINKSAVSHTQAKCVSLCQVLSCVDSSLSHHPDPCVCLLGQFKTPCARSGPGDSLGQRAAAIFGGARGCEGVAV